MVHDLEHDERCFAVIIGAGPSGLAVAAGLTQQNIPFIILEQANCIASLWQNRTYDRLKLHLPKQFCQLPYFPFNEQYPEYPTKYQFIEYLESYAKKFEIKPRFNETVKSVKYDNTCGLWLIESFVTKGELTGVVNYIWCRWVVVASGENAEKIIPQFDGLKEFGGIVMHACDYKSGKDFEGKNVMVVGCGNSGMEISLDLCHHKANPSMVVRSSVHVLPLNMFGTSTYGLAAKMLKWMPVCIVDRILLALSRFILGDIEKLGLKRPLIGPLQLKNSGGKTPVLDTGAVLEIKSGDITIIPEIIKFSRGRVELVNGQILDIDSVILATGYCRNVPSWLKEKEFLPNGWKGKKGIYAVGFSKNGLAGASMDAIEVSKDIGKRWDDL